MLSNKLAALLFGIILCLPAILVPAPTAQADDIEIYTSQADQGNGNTPLVVLNLDLNIDPADIVCNNVLLDPGNLPTGGTCDLLQQLTVLPVLRETLGTSTDNILGALTGTLDGLLGGLGDLTGDVTGPLQEMLGSDDHGTGSAISQLDVVRLLLYRVLHQLVGVRVAILASHANTCEPAGFASPRRDTADCSNGAVVLLKATEILEDNINTTVDRVLGRIGDTAGTVGDANEYTICHKPGTSSEKTMTFRGGIPSGHLNHGDTLGSCEPEPMEPHPFQGKEVYYELIRYLRGGPVFNANLDADDSLPLTADPAAIDGSSYVSPLTDNTCGEIHVVNILLTNPQAQDESDAAILGDSALSGVDLDGNGDLTFPEMTTYLDRRGFAHGGGRYTINSTYLVNGLEGGGPTRLLSNLVGTTMNLPTALNPLATDYVRPESFVPVSTISASFGGPQTVYNGNDPMASGDQLYTGLFRPYPEDESGNKAPAWVGNLKKLKTTDSGTDTTIVDQNGNPAVGPDGRIRDTALTFWTDADGLPSNPDAVAERDGNIANRGGAGMFLLPPDSNTANGTNPSETNPAATGSNQEGPRVFYQSASDNGTLSVAPLNLDDTTVTESDPVLPGNRLDAAEQIAWARGYETADLNVDQQEEFLAFLDDTISNLTDLLKDVLSDLLCLFDCPSPPTPEAPPAQDWIMGDVLHSHPLAIDYGGANDVRIFTGTNQGFLHQFRDSADGGDTFAGQEVWRFSPRTVMANYETWRTGSSEHGPYGVDGVPAAYIEDSDGVINESDGDRVHLYFGLRRGGKSYYALDVTDPDAKPDGLWHIRKGDSGFSELGLTFSTPQVGHIAPADAEAEPRPVLIFGGGYDSDKDSTDGSSDAVGTHDDEGNALYVVNAETGALIWKATEGGTTGAGTSDGADVWTHPALDDSIASTPTAVDSTGDGFLDRIYVGDTGGRVWRADIGNTDPANWKMAPIANLGRHASGGATVANDRRFFHAPDVVRVNNGVQSFFAVIIASGNRADPLNTNTDNRLFVIKNAGPLDVDTEPAEPDELADFASNCSGSDCASLLDPGFTHSGWQMPLPRAGEKALAMPVTLTGKVLFTSYIPPDPTEATCRPREGTGRLYAVDLRTGEPAIDDFNADGEATTGSGALNNARGTPMATPGIPASVHYLESGMLLGSDYGFMQVDHRRVWPTYWRERVGEH